MDVCHITRFLVSLGTHIWQGLHSPLIPPHFRGSEGLRTCNLIQQPTPGGGVATTVCIPHPSEQPRRLLSRDISALTALNNRPRGGEEADEILRYFGRNNSSVYTVSTPQPEPEGGRKHLQVSPSLKLGGPIPVFGVCHCFACMQPFAAFPAHACPINPQDYQPLPPPASVTPSVASRSSAGPKSPPVKSPRPESKNFNYTEIMNEQRAELAQNPLSQHIYGDTNQTKWRM